MEQAHQKILPSILAQTFYGLGTLWGMWEFVPPPEGGLAWRILFRWYMKQRTSTSYTQSVWGIAGQLHRSAVCLAFMAWQQKQADGVFWKCDHCRTGLSLLSRTSPDTFVQTIISVLTRVQPILYCYLSTIHIVHCRMKFLFSLGVQKDSDNKSCSRTNNGTLTFRDWIFSSK